MLIEESSKINAIYKKYKDYDVIHSIYSFHCIFLVTLSIKYIFILYHFIMNNLLIYSTRQYVQPIIALTEYMFVISKKTLT